MTPCYRYPYYGGTDRGRRCPRRYRLDADLFPGGIGFWWVIFAYGIIGGIISGSAKDAFGSYKIAFYPTAGMAILGVIVALILLRPPKK